MNHELDELIKMAHGYRLTRFLIYLIKSEYYKTRYINIDFKIEKTLLELGFSEKETFEKYFNPNSRHYMGDFILYQEKDYHVWKSLGKKLSQPIKSHSSKLVDIKKYVNRMDQQNKNLSNYINAGLLKGNFRNKVILDVGCGSGYYSRAFRKLGCDIVAVDKKEIIDVVHKRAENKGIGFISGEYPNINILMKKLPKSFDMIWLSEILHGKNHRDCMNILIKSQHLLKDGGYIIINELRTGTALSVMFDYQMDLHTEGGELHSQKVLGTMLKACKYKEIEASHFTPYHVLIRGKL